MPLSKHPRHTQLSQAQSRLSPRRTRPPSVLLLGVGWFSCSLRPASPPPSGGYKFQFGRLTSKAPGQSKHAGEEDARERCYARRKLLLLPSAPCPYKRLPPGALCDSGGEAGERGSQSRNHPLPHRHQSVLTREQTSGKPGERNSGIPDYHPPPGFILAHALLRTKDVFQSCG